jgi:hypothetical protein
MSFKAWRRLHRAASAVLAGLATLHSALTPLLYGAWTREALWFLGTGLGLFLLAAVNWAHVGTEPCRQPTAPLIRWANVGYLAFGIGALLAVPEPQAFVIVASLAAQALAGWATLRTPPDPPLGDPTNCDDVD